MNCKADHLMSLALAALTGLMGAPAAIYGQKTPHQYYEALNALRLDGDSVYPIVPDNRIELRRGDAKISFEEGKLIFFVPLDGQITGVVFTGRGHVLALPREITEKQQLARFLGAPILDQSFTSAYIRFTDGTAQELLQQLQGAQLKSQSDATLLSRLDPVLSQLNKNYSVRIMSERLLASPKPFFHASLDGISIGPFDVLLDAMRLEQFLLGQARKSGGTNFYDVWASYRVPDTAPPVVSFHATHYRLETTILADHSLASKAAVQIHGENAGDRLLTFNLSRSLSVDSVTDEAGQALDFFQNEGITPQERSVRGNDYLYVVLPAAPARESDFTVHFHYRGNIISDAGNDVLFVGARESWYPHLGDSADFARYDLSMRWPRKLRLVATGSKLEEHDDGEMRAGTWHSEKPVSVAGFNLGEYASNFISSANYSIDIYANRQLEEALAKRFANSGQSDDSGPVIPRRRSFGISTDMPLAPSPANAVKQLGKEIDASIRFYENYCGPFPFRNLSVSQIPGSFGQGWPGLLYISTFSFLSAEAQLRTGLTSSGQEHFTELVPFHEVAHQWWGNVVGWSSYRDQWINEAMANYMALLFADTHKNPEHTLHVWLQRYRRTLVQKSINADAPAGEIGALTLGTRLDSSKSPNAYEDLIYSKGAWVMHMLREMLRQPGANPDARFNTLLHTLVSKYAYRALSTEDLRHEVEAVMTPSMDLEGGHSMEWFFEEWVRGTGIPHYRVEFSSHKTDSGYVIRGKLFQSGVPQSFIARVPLYSGGATGRPVLLGSVVAAGAETSFHFASSNPVRKIVIDPQMTLLNTAE
jgi:hypothetical protein